MVGMGKLGKKHVWDLLWLSLTCKTCEMPPDGQAQAGAPTGPTEVDWICCMGPLQS